MIQTSLRDAIGVPVSMPALKGRPKFMRRYAAILSRKTAGLTTLRGSRVNAAEETRILCVRSFSYSV